MGYVSSVSSDVTAYETVSLSGEVSFSGLGNGTDFEEIIEACVDAESYKKEAYEEDLEETEYLIELMEDLETELEDLAETLEDMDSFLVKDATCSSDEVEVTADDEAATGTHTVIVDQLAQSDVWVFTDTGYSSTDDVVTTTATTLELTYAGETISIDIAAGTTLDGLVSTVNANVNANGNVTADLIYDGSNYYFSITGDDTGADNAIEITDTGSLTGWSTTGFTNTQEAANARIKVDGFPTDADSWLERDTNTIDDVIDGLTIELKDTTDEDGLRITVDLDTDAMTEQIETFISSVNQVIYDMQVLTGRVEADTDDDEETYTVDNYAMDIMYNQIKSVLSSSALGFLRYDEETGGDYYTALSQIGISTDADEGSDTFGQLLLDDDELAEALAEDPEAVAQLFSASAVGESDSEDFQVLSVIDSVTPAGEHEVAYTIENGVLVSATIDGEEASIEGDWGILGTTSSSSGLYISVVNQVDGDYTGTARVKEGKIQQMVDTIEGMTNEESGTLTILIENYEEQVTSLDNQIYNEEKRLDTLETSLTRRYAALDATLSEYEGIATTLESLLESLSDS
jgi:flagellar hook-associated protein 2